MTKRCVYQEYERQCTDEACYIVVGETISCWFELRRAEPDKAEFCEVHGEQVRAMRQEKTPVR